jgi:ATP-dependent RNA helicase DDX24/MAK5
LNVVTKYTDVTTACIIGGLALVKQERVLNSNPHIVIGTPGRVWELFQSGNKHLQKIAGVSYLVIDETDRMIQKGHFAELEHIVELMNSSEANPKRQNFVFSATLTMTHDLPEYVMKRKKKLVKASSKEQLTDALVSMFGMKNPKVFDITKNSGVAEKVVGECITAFYILLLC